MGMMEQVWILLSAGAIWLMVREAEKADAREYVRRRVMENRQHMRESIDRAAYRRQQVSYQLCAHNRREDT